jgi:ABC-type Fe3+ transport system permease subunit
MMIPYITPPAVVGLLFAYMFDGNFGVVNDLLVKAGAIDQYVSWLSDPTGSFGVTVAAMVWYGQPLMALILLASLQTIPQALYDAAQVDGASAWQQFRYITLPHLMPSILFLVLLRVIWMSNHIDMIFVLTQGGPGFSNYTAAVYSFKLTNQFEIGFASAVAVVLTIILVAASAMYVRHLARKVLVTGVTTKRSPGVQHAAVLGVRRRRGGPCLFARAVPVDRHRLDHAGDQGLRHAERAPRQLFPGASRRSTTTSISSPTTRSSSTSATARSSRPATCC